MKVKIYVAAGTMNEYADFLKQQILPPGTFQWLTGLRMLYGVDDPVVITIGTWYMHKDLDDLPMFVLSRWRPS